MSTNDELKTRRIDVFHKKKNIFTYSILEKRLHEYFYVPSGVSAGMDRHHRPLVVLHLERV